MIRLAALKCINNQTEYDNRKRKEINRSGVGPNRNGVPHKNIFISYYYSTERLLAALVRSPFSAKTKSQKYRRIPACSYSVHTPCSSTPESSNIIKFE